VSHFDSLFEQDKNPQVQVSCSMSEGERDLLDKLLVTHGGMARNKFVAAMVRDGIEMLKKRPVPETEPASEPAKEAAAK